MGHINNDGREEAGLRGPHKKPYQIEFPRRVDKRHQRGYDSPGNHDAGNPAARAPSFSDQCPGNFQHHVSDEEHAGAQSNHLVVESQVVRHLQSRRAYVHAVQESDHVKQEKKGKKSPRNSFSRALGDRRLKRCVGHVPSIRRPSESGGDILHHFVFFAAQICVA